MVTLHKSTTLGRIHQLLRMLVKMKVGQKIQNTREKETLAESRHQVLFLPSEMQKELTLETIQFKLPIPCNATSHFQLIETNRKVKTLQGLQIMSSVTLYHQVLKFNRPC